MDLVIHTGIPLTCFLLILPKKSVVSFPTYLRDLRLVVTTVSDNYVALVQNTVASKCWQP